jgi:hypothetical protein
VGLQKDLEVHSQHHDSNDIITSTRADLIVRFYSLVRISPSPPEMYRTKLGTRPSVGFCLASSTAQSRSHAFCALSDTPSEWANQS